VDGKTATLGPPVAVSSALIDARTGRPEPLRPLTPTFTADGNSVLFAAPDRGHRFHLYQAPVDGRPAHELAPPRWEEPPRATVIIRTLRAGAPSPVPARLHVEAGDGHPLLPSTGIVRMDSQSGLTYLYSDGTLTLQVPPGVVRVVAARGLSAPSIGTEVTLQPGETRTVNLTLTPLWDAAAAGYVAGDHHFHLNYGGPYAVGVAELQQILRAEDMDVATPMVANLHNRLQDLLLWPTAAPGSPPAPPRPAGEPLIEFAHEVRSHFLGHLGVVGVPSPFWPWYWGPGYPVYGRDDRPNSDVLQDTRRRGGVGSYVHPVAVRDPFAQTASAAPGAAIPLMLIADAVLGDLDALEVACLWSDELGTSAVWQRLLNLGLPIALSAGTDAMVNVHRNMAVGSTRIYVRHSGPLTLPSYLAALRAGHSFVTNGPFLELTVEGKRPGEALATAVPREVEFAVELAAAMPVTRLEILVNGEVAFRSPVSTPVLAAAGRTTVHGRVAIPAGGWLSARAVGEKMAWPGMDSYPFALTSPVWIGRIGSTHPPAQRAAAAELLVALASAESRLRAAFTPAEAPRLHLDYAYRGSLTRRPAVLAG
jgi:TolB protein